MAMAAGIDGISFYSSQYFVDLRKLADARGVDPAKYAEGLGQLSMGVVPPDEDVITLGASAAAPLVSRYQADEFDIVMFATESGVDESKAGAIYIRHLLGLSRECRVVELKQACYSSTVGLQLALSYVRAHPNRKVLLVASDIARYGLGTPGEPTQGCGAVAMVVSMQPRVLVVDSPSGYYTEDVMDFWRPCYSNEAFVDGKFSAKLYLATLEHTWNAYVRKSGLKFEDHDRFCYHLPFSRMAEKAHARLAAGVGSIVNGANRSGEDPPGLSVDPRIADGLIYNRVTGNSYSASLYLGLTSLLDNSREDLGGKRIGFFSYGSGCSAEFYSGTVSTGYRSQLFVEEHHQHLQRRTELSVIDYEKMFQFRLPTDGGNYPTPNYRTGRFRFAGLVNHKRIYGEAEATAARVSPHVGINGAAAAISGQELRTHDR